MSDRTIFFFLSLCEFLLTVITDCYLRRGNLEKNGLDDKSINILRKYYLYRIVSYQPHHITIIIIIIIIR